MKKILRYGSREIEYQIEFKDRKTLRISVSPDLNVKMVAPEGAQLEKIDAIMNKRAPWILKQQGFFLAFYPRQPAKSFINGETHLYLGKQYRLKISRRRKESVRLSGQFIHVECSDPRNVKALLNEWYFDHALVRLSLYAETWIDKFRRYEVRPSQVVLQAMPKRWGSCTSKGKIILNPELIKTPKGCIEYVIVHELCHLVHHNHSTKFVALQSKVMPQWEKWKAHLERIMA